MLDGVVIDAGYLGWPLISIPLLTDRTQRDLVPCDIETPVHIVNIVCITMKIGMIFFACFKLDLRKQSQ